MATRFFAAIVAAFMSMSTLSASNNQNSKNIMKPVIVQKDYAQVLSIEVSGTDNIKYVYNLDENGRVTNRVSYKFNSKNGKWTPVSVYSVFYGEEENVLTYAEYNSQRKLFNSNPQQKRFNANEYPELIRIPQVCEK